MLTIVTVFAAIPILAGIVLVSTFLSPLPNELLPAIYDPGAVSKLAFDHHLTKYDAKLIKQVSLFMNMEDYFSKGSTIAYPAHIFVTGNIKYPALVLDHFNFRNYFGDFEVYTKASFSTRGNFEGHPFGYWYREFGKNVFYKCWFKKIEASFGPYLTYESNPELFLAVKEWYMTWGPNPSTELRELFVRFFVPFGEDLNNPEAFIDGRFWYTFTGPSQQINFSVDGWKYPTYFTWKYGKVNLLYAWPKEPEDHQLFIDLVRLSAKGLEEYRYPQTSGQALALKHTMETFLNIYYKNLVHKIDSSSFSYANLVSVDSERVRNPWGSASPDFLTLSDLGIIKDVCWV